MNINSVLFIVALLLATFQLRSQQPDYKNEDFRIEGVRVSYDSELEITIWEISVSGKAGKTVPTKAGKLDGAPVLGYVFPTNLNPVDVGFNYTEGIVTLALTSHPDFDDTPLWDENGDQVFDNDGVFWHPHWVILEENKMVEGGFSVKQFKKADSTVILPPTNPGMPMYMDSPGYQVTTSGQVIRAIIPKYRINNKLDFSYDGVTAYLKVNASKDELPMLGVYEVYSIASGDLSLPYKVKRD